MKKAKVILTAITVFAVVGGALAFKAKSANFCYYTLNQQQVCTLVGTIEDYDEATAGPLNTKAIEFTGSCPATQDNCDQRITFTSSDL